MVQAGRCAARAIGFSLAACLAAAGCTQVTGSAARFDPVPLPDDRAIPRAVVYGGLMDRLPHYDVTPALEMFLYGPNDYGRTALRNPQGLTLAGNLLLVCDQGLPDVVGIDLSTGRSLPFTDGNHRPRCPVAVAADDAQVYVADTRSWCVAVYDFKGRLREELAPTTDPNRRFQPASLLLRDGILYAGNIGEHRVDRFDLRSRTWLEPLVPPADAARLVAPTGLEMTPDGTLLIADGLQGHVQRVTREGAWLRPIGRAGRGEGQFVRPKQLCLTSSGLLAVVDAGRQSVLVFSAGGEFLLEVIGGDRRWHGFTLPAGVIPLPADRLPALGVPAGDYVIVTDALGGTPLTLIGIVTRQPGEVAHAR